MRDFEVEVEFAPFLLDPTTPPEGKPRRPMSRPNGAPSPLEERGKRLGINFARGRSLTSNSHLALEGAEFATEQGLAWPYHRAMLKAYFEDLEDVGQVETVVRVGAAVGVDGDGLREALVSRSYSKLVDEGIAWSRSIGVSAIPTFIFDERYAMVGAQEYAAFESVLMQIGARRRAGDPAAPDSAG